MQTDSPTSQLAERPTTAVASGGPTTVDVALAPQPYAVAEFADEGVSDIASITATGETGDIVVIAIARVGDSDEDIRVIDLDPPLEQSGGAFGGYGGGLDNRLTLGRYWYRFQVSRPQTFTFHFARSHYWRCRAVVYRGASGTGALEEQNWGSRFNGTVAYTRSQSGQSVLPIGDDGILVDIVAGRSDDPTIYTPDPDPGVYAGFQHYGRLIWDIKNESGFAYSFYSPGSPFPINLNRYDWEAALESGDLLLLFGHRYENGLYGASPYIPLTPLPAGFTMLHQNDASQARWCVAYKVWHPGDPTIFNPVGHLTTVMVYRGAHPTDPIAGFSSTGPLTLTHANSTVVHALFVDTTRLTNFSIPSPENNYAVNGVEFFDQGNMNVTTTGNRIMITDQRLQPGLKNQLAWEWSGGASVSTLPGVTTQAMVALRPAITPTPQGPTKPTPAFFDRTDGTWHPRSYVPSTGSGSAAVSSILITAETASQLGPVLPAHAASIAIGFTGIDTYHGDNPQAGVDWKTTDYFSEEALAFLTGFTAEEEPENQSGTMFLDDEGNVLALHPFEPLRRDQWGYGPAISPDGTLLFHPSWYRDSCGMQHIDGRNLWRTENYLIQNPPAFSADGTKIYALEWSDNLKLIVLDAFTGDYIESKNVVGLDVWNYKWTPDGYLVGANYQNNTSNAGILRTDPETGVTDVWLPWSDYYDQLPYGPQIEGAWQLDTHPGGEGFAVCVRYDYPFTYIIEFSWAGEIVNTYLFGDWATDGNFEHQAINLAYSRDGNYIYTTNDLGNLLVRFERGPGNVGGEAPFMNSSYLTRADWEADGFPDHIHNGQNDDHAQWYATLSGVDTRFPTTLRGASAVKDRRVKVRGRDLP